MIKTCLVISINAYQKRKLKIQLDTIYRHVFLDYVVLINASEQLYHNLNKCDWFKSLDKVLLNPQYIDKQRMHGSITHGIYLNIKFAKSTMMFDYFLVMSQNCLFYKKLNTKHDLKNSSSVIEKHPVVISPLNRCSCKPVCKTDSLTGGGSCTREWESNYILPLVNSAKYNGYQTKYGQLVGNTNSRCPTARQHCWWWLQILNTKLAQYITEKNLKFFCSAHEGLVFDYTSCNNIMIFLDTYTDIRLDIFSFKCCAEEVALQTIAGNSDGTMYYVGNGNEYLEKFLDIGPDRPVSNNRLIYKSRMRTSVL